MTNNHRRQAERKPLSFSTTLRNPHRIVDFLFCIKDYNGEVLTDEIIYQVIKKVICLKIYHTNYELNDQILREIYLDNSRTFSDEQLDEIINNSPQQHKEAGYEKGWPSRFNTWYALLKEFGFLDYSYGKQIRITESGKYLLSSLGNSEGVQAFWNYDEDIIEASMLNALVKYRTNNPFRRNANNNRPLILLLKTIEEMKNSLQSQYKGIELQELAFLICWPDENARAASNYIIHFRNSYGVFASNEIIYDQCLHLLGAGRNQSKRFKMSQITGEAIDDYLRKMRSTGIIAFRGNGNYIDENSLKEDKIRYIIDNYCGENAQFFDCEENYISFMGEIDDKLISPTENGNVDLNQIRSYRLKIMAETYQYKKIAEELSFLKKRQQSHEPTLRVIDAPTRFEFLISIFLAKKYGVEHVFPNYIVDDEGYPTHHAGGGRGDIICQDDGALALFEVSLITSGSNQLNREIIPMISHISNYGCSEEITKFAVLICPIIQEVTKQATYFYIYQVNKNIFADTTDNFQQKALKSEDLLQLYKMYYDENYPNIVSNARQFLE